MLQTPSPPSLVVDEQHLCFDRWRRTAPDNYNADGTIKRGPKVWRRSNRYRQLASKRAEIERRLADERKRAHGELCNAVLAMGDEIKTERLDAPEAQKAWARAEPLLRRAASSFNQSASGRASAAPQVRASEQIARQVQKPASRPRMSYGLVPEGRGEMSVSTGTPRL